MLEIKDLRFRYSRRSPLVLDGANLELKDGEIVSGVYHPEEGMFTDFDDLSDPAVEGF